MLGLSYWLQGCKAQSCSVHTCPASNSACLQYIADRLSRVGKIRDHDAQPCSTQCKQLPQRCMNVDTTRQMSKSHVTNADVQGRSIVLLCGFCVPSEAYLTLQQHDTRLLRSTCYWELSADIDINSIQQMKAAHWKCLLTSV